MAGDMTASETPAQKALRKANAQLVRDLVPGDTYNDLFSMGYLSAPQLEEIRGLADQKKHSRANEEIVSAMMKRSDAEIVAFCELLYKKQQRKCGEALLKALKMEKAEGLSGISTVPVVAHRTPQYYPQLDEMDDHLIHLMTKIKEVTKDREDVKFICNRLLSSMQRIEKVDAKQAISRLTSPKCTSAEAIDLMQQFIDYLDCRLLSRLIRALKSETLKVEWDIFRQKLGDACRKSLHACKSSLKDYTPPRNGITVGLQTTFVASDLQIRKILEVQQFLCNEMGLEESDFQGFACSVVTLFFAVLRARLPFLLSKFSRHHNALEDIGIAVVYVPGEFIYDVQLDHEHLYSQDDVCQDQGMLQEVKKMFTDMKSGLLTLQKQVTESMHSQTAHFQKRELYQQDKIQLQEQVSKLIDKNLASQDMSAAMSKLETLAEELEVLSKRIQLESLSETIEELHKFKDTFAENADELTEKMDKHQLAIGGEVQAMKELIEGTTLRLSLKESRGAVPNVEKTEVEQLSQMATSDVLEVADPSWRASTVLQQKLTEVVDTQTQLLSAQRKEMEDRHQFFLDQYEKLMEEHHLKFEAELKQLQDFKSTLFAELHAHIEGEIKKQKDGLQFEVPSKFQRIIIGPRGQNIKRIEAKTGVFNIRIVPGPREDVGLVTMIGDNRRCEAAKKEIKILVAKTVLSREKKMAIVTAVQGDFTLSLAEYKGIVPITYQTELHFRRFYYLKLCQPAKTKTVNEDNGEKYASQVSEVLDWSKLRNYSIMSSRFQNALEETLKSGSIHMGMEARFGKIFFKAERKLTADELHAEFPVADVEKDGLINVSKLAIGSSHWTFVTALPTSKFKVPDPKLPLIWEYETLDINFTYIPQDPKDEYVHFVLHTYRDNKGVFQFVDMWPKLGKDLVFDCLSLHGRLDLRLVLDIAEEPHEISYSAVTKLGKTISAGLDVKGGVVLLSDELPKDVYEAFRVSFVRHELQRMYLAKDEGRCYLLAHCTVAECDSQQKELADDARKFPLGEPHQELELKNCQWLADFSHMIGVNWMEQVTSFGCDVSDIHVVPKPVDAATVVQELKHFAKYALQIAQGWEEQE